MFDPVFQFALVLIASTVASALGSRWYRRNHPGSDRKSPVRWTGIHAGMLVGLLTAAMLINSEALFGSDLNTTQYGSLLLSVSPQLATMMSGGIGGLAGEFSARHNLSLYDAFRVATSTLLPRIMPVVVLIGVVSKTLLTYNTVVAIAVGIVLSVGWLLLAPQRIAPLRFPKLNEQSRQELVDRFPDVTQFSTFLDGRESQNIDSVTYIGGIGPQVLVVSDPITNLTESDVAYAVVKSEQEWWRKHVGVGTVVVGIPVLLLAATYSNGGSLGTTFFVATMVSYPILYLLGTYYMRQLVYRVDSAVYERFGPEITAERLQQTATESASKYKNLLRNAPDRERRRRRLGRDEETA